MTNNLRTVVMFIFSTLIAISLNGQTEEPDWQDLNTHWLDSEGNTFSKEAEDAVLKAILYDMKLPEDASVKVTNILEFCDDHDKRCFAAAIYTIDSPPKIMDEIQFFVWLDRMWLTNDHFEYRKVWEYRTENSNASGSLSMFDAPNASFFNPCLLVKTSDDGDAYHAVTMRFFCLNRSNYPEILLEYTGDHTHESTAQEFQKSISIFRDIDEDGVNELIVDTVEGYQPGWEQGDQKFQISLDRTIYYYDDQLGKFLAIESSMQK